MGRNLPTLQDIKMQPFFWHERWQNSQIGFHLGEANPLLIQHLSALNLKQGARIFLPLCGKTLDIAWLLSQGFQVAGAELSAIAVEALFAQLDLKPTITPKGEITLYSAPHIDVFMGDIVKLSATVLGKVDAVYDRAALVALPAPMRLAYAKHLQALTQQAPQLLICFVYDQTQHAGPPFAITADEVQQHYASAYDLELLTSVEVAGGLKGQCAATEQVWRLQPK